MKWIKYFESFNNDEVLDNIIDILSEISDTGRYRVEEYNNNPPDVPVVKNNLNRIKFYIDKDYLKTGNEINKEDIKFISPVLDRLQRYLQTYNIDLYFEIRISKKILQILKFLLLRLKMKKYLLKSEKVEMVVIDL